MKSETLVQRHPPTPPNVGNDLHAGLHHIAQYNVGRSYSFDESLPHSSGYGSPEPVVHDAIQQHHHQAHAFHATHNDSHSGSDLGLGIQYDRYGQGHAYFPDGQINGVQHNQTFYSNSPPTPRSAIDHDDANRRTRSGRTIVPSGSPHGTDNPKPNPRPKAAPKSRKAKAGKSEKPKTPKLTAPLSILTKDMANIPVRNMEEWVNRSAEVRRQEVEKRNGYVTRPMNSFMLYRSAYADRTKQWCLQNNHQIVSSVSGESWPLEPPEIRELYNEYAKIERINHQNAHPSYKFSPSKASAAPARKRKGEFSDEEASDLDGDPEWNPGNRTRIKARRMDRSIGYPANSMNTGYFNPSFGPNGHGMNKSAWDMTNEGRPMPMPMQSDMYNQYYQTSVHPAMGLGPAVMEDLRMRRVDTPGSSMQFSPGHALLGLPGGNAADLMHRLQSHSGTPLGDEGQVDPMLLAFDGTQHELDPAIAPHPEFRNGHMSMLERDLDQDSVNSLLGTGHSHDDYQPEQWQSDPNMTPLEQGSEFEKWMDDHHVG
ncbi:hypothetical protein K491DRAFT_684743 [Lophiostoma macrostomum CBS 122681]|uniref:HMG box domain-containing protein n=1 Tax=Lophiostoma macrostomum CBS 122681 TaxID=1314788 RepID=A0A6A6SMX6_9PLEO|nr:hypothetical protein K491DRAFT_684743 [Lophiostoma macrostomum CBS 122681]